MYRPLSADDLAAATGAGVRVLLMDSGVNVEHEVFGDLDIPRWKVERHRVEPDQTGDTSGHGTGVASILRAFAPQAQLESLRILQGLKLGGAGPAEGALVGLEWGLERGFDVINCSFITERSALLPQFKRLVDRAFRQGVLVVASSDNLRPDHTPRYPCDFPSVLGTTYAALPGLGLQRRPGLPVEFAARGENVRVAWRDGGYRRATGASFAAPHLAALAARIRQLRPDWNACQVRTCLYDLAEDAQLSERLAAPSAPSHRLDARS